LLAGFTTPAALRFEAVAPFGPPVFILAGRDNRATLLLPRDNRVLRDADVAQLLERLTGLSLAADDVRLILTGCLVDGGGLADGRVWPNGWRGVTVGAGITAYLNERNGVTTVVAADHGDWRVDYADHQNGIARTVRIRSAGSVRDSEPSAIDISAVLGQLEINTAIAAKAFEVEVPPGAIPITLDDLRAVAPLRGSN
jgi:outer membrane biogenesis lipoprotein LolB